MISWTWHQKQKQQKQKLNKWDHTELKSFCTAKETTNDKQPMKWDKIFENYVSDKELIPNIYTELTKLNSKTILIIQFKIG